jgi:hypothetical protein
MRSVFPFPIWSNRIYKNVSMNTSEHILYEDCFFGPNFWGSCTHDSPKQDLAKFGYASYIKVEFILSS